MKFLLTLMGSLFVALGMIGIVVPGLPTTPFLLLAAACYARSSPRFYKWLIEHRTYGPLIADFVQKGGVKKKTKIFATLFMWAMVLVSVIFFISNIYLQILCLVSAAAGTFVLMKLKTL